MLFTGIQQEVYSGMIIGECSRDGEMEVQQLAQRESPSTVVYKS